MFAHNGRTETSVVLKYGCFRDALKGDFSSNRNKCCIEINQRNSNKIIKSIVEPKQVLY